MLVVYVINDRIGHLTGHEEVRKYTEGEDVATIIGELAT